MQRASDDEFIAAWDRCNGSPSEVATFLGISKQNVHKRRGKLVEKGVILQTIDFRGRQTAHSGPVTQFERRRLFNVADGKVVVFTDPHYLPDHSTVAHNALENVIQQEKPVGLICAGDAADGDTISRYDPTRGHHKRFTVREEMECVKEHFDSLDRVKARWCPNAWLAWTLGNHDVRLSRYIATKAPELMDMPFNRLEDWVPNWPLSWTAEINSGTAGMTVVRHRNQAGQLHLQAQKAGCHYVHGHLHKLNVHNLATFAGKRYSADGGSLADPASKGFDYTEGGPEHAQGFLVLTYRNGKLLWPEICYIEDGVAIFRNEVVS